MNLINNLLDLVYPPRCITCEEILLPFKNNFLCENCSDESFFNEIEGPYCICGLNITICKGCGPHYFTKNTAAFLYEGMVQEVIHKLKYGRKAYVASGIAKLMATQIGIEPFKNAHYIVPVPIHKNRHRKRGFNQSELIATQLSKNLNLKRPKNLILRIKDTKPLSKFTPAVREATLKNAFFIRPEYNLQGKNIVIVDDIFTTGATLNACAKLLHEKKVNDVSCVTFSVVPT